MTVANVARYWVASCSVLTSELWAAMCVTSACVVVSGISHISANSRRSFLAILDSSKLHHEISRSGACEYTSKGSTPGVPSNCSISGRPSGRATLVQCE